jgi:hypothetical protein
MFEQEKPMKNLLAVSLSALALSACSGVRLQSADELGHNLYQSGQQYGKEQCLKSTSPTAAECLRRDGASYDDYKKAREKARSGAQ